MLKIEEYFTEDLADIIPADKNTNQFINMGKKKISVVQADSGPKTQREKIYSNFYQKD